MNKNNHHHTLVRASILAHRTYCKFLHKELLVDCTRKYFQAGFLGEDIPSGRLEKFLNKIGLRKHASQAYDLGTVARNVYEEHSNQT